MHLVPGQPFLERDGSGQEQRVESGAVEAFADEVAGGDDHEGRPGAGTKRWFAAARSWAATPPSSTTGCGPCSAVSAAK